MRLVERFKTLGIVKLIQLLLGLDVLQVIKQVLGSADERGVTAQLGRKDGQAALRQRDLTLKALLNRRAPLRARLRHRAADDHHIGIEQIRDTCNGLAQGDAGVHDDLMRRRLAFGGATGDLGAIDAVSRDLGVTRLDAASRCHQLQMPGAAAHARDAHSLRAGYMPDLAGETMVAAHQTAMSDHGAADAGTSRDHHAGFGPAGSAPTRFAEPMGLHVVEHRNRQLAGLLQARLDGLAGPPGHDLVSVRDTARDRVHTACGGHADAEHLLAARTRLGKHRVRHIAHGDENRAAPALRLRGHLGLKHDFRGSVDLLVSQQRAGDLRAADVKRRNVCGIFHAPYPSLFEKHLITWCKPWYRKQKSRRGWNLRRLAKAKKSYLRMGASASMRPTFLMTSTMAATSSPSSG